MLENKLNKLLKKNTKPKQENINFDDYIEKETKNKKKMIIRIILIILLAISIIFLIYLKKPEKKVVNIEEQIRQMVINSLTKNDLDKLIQEKENEKIQKEIKCKLNINSKNMKVYKNLSYINFKYPENWEYIVEENKTNKGLNYSYAIRFRRNDMLVMIVDIGSFSKNIEEKDMEIYKKVIVKKIIENKNIKLIGSGEKEINNKKFNYINFFSKDENEKTIYNIHYFFSHKNIIYGVTFSDKGDKITEVNNLAKQILQSIVFKNIKKTPNEMNN